MARCNVRHVPVLCELVSRQPIVPAEIRDKFFKSMASAIEAAKALCTAEMAKTSKSETEVPVKTASESSREKPASRGAQKRPAKQRQNETEPALEQVLRRYVKQYIVSGINETMKALEKNDALLFVHVRTNAADASEELPTWYPIDAAMNACEARRVATLSVSQDELDILFTKPLGMSRCTVITFRRSSLGDCASLFRTALADFFQTLELLRQPEAQSDLFSASVRTGRTVSVVPIAVAVGDRPEKRKQLTPPQVSSVSKTAKKQTEKV